MPKRDELQTLLEHCSTHVMGLSETWLDESVDDAEIDMTGFRVYRKDRNRNGGGVAVYVSDDVKSVRRYDLEEEGVEALWIQVKMKKLQVLICNMYRPPDALVAWMDSLATILERAVQEKLSVVMLGDFNCDFMSPNPRANKLASVMEEYGLTQMIDGPTRITQNSESQIDLIFTTDSGLLNRVGCEELGLSDLWRAGR